MEIEKSYIYRLRFLYGILCTVLVLFVLVVLVNTLLTLALRRGRGAR